MSYTTDEGALIDADSEPGNGKLEDDLSKSELTFEIKEDVRKISGNVAEANNKEGKLDGEKIDDVIVQLIEIVEVEKDGQKKSYEYIWQETRSGSKEVKARSTSNNVYTYQNQLEGDITGKYQFLGYSASAKDSSTEKEVSLNTGFIPGNYIIRFIYGDGTTYDLTDNVVKYNGQDYKSTVDKNYKEEWYSKAKYGENVSTARDNEARRLEVMAFSAEVDGELGTALKILDVDINEYGKLNSEEQELLKEFYNSNKGNEELVYIYKLVENIPLEQTVTLPDSISNELLFRLIKNYIAYKTWMSAETSKIAVEINSETFNNVNLGLMERPQTILEIEKHITALKITPSGTGVEPIIDAKLENLPQIIEERTTKPNITGITTGLAPILSARNNRGFWYVATDVEELMQGAKLEVEYTYVIRNTSDEDYLSTLLVSQFGTSDYSKFLRGKSLEVKNNRQKGAAIPEENFLGTYYYTGVAGEKDSAVPSTVDILEEAINNKLSFEENENNKAFKIAAETKGDEPVIKKVYGVDGTIEEETIGTIVETTEPSNALTKGSKDFTKTIKLTTTLSAAQGGEIGADIPSYIAEITKYSNAAGRQNIAVPENLTYVHSNDNTKTLESGNNEIDEFWGETIIISKPTGEDKNIAMLIAIVSISAVAVIGIGIILIKKYVIKK